MKTLLPAYALSALALLASGCGGGGGGSDRSDIPNPVPTLAAGTVAVSLTDAPSCGFDAVNITVNKVRINSSANADDSNTGWTDIILSPARKINLLNLGNGALEALGEASLAAGHYSQLRLVLNSDATANTVVPAGSTAEIALDTPSAVQSGIKLVNEFDVASGQRVDLVLDFDACKSIVAKGNGKYALKPVVKVVPTALNGITGFMSPSVLENNIRITAQQDGAIVAATSPGTTGAFTLARLPTGTYTVVITGDGRNTMVIGGVPVASATSMVQLSTMTTPLAPDVSMFAGISGKVVLTPDNPTEPAYVAASQTITGGPVVTVKYQATELGTGLYALTGLPINALQYAVYSTTLPLVFTQPFVTPGAGAYKVEASAAGYASQSNPNVPVAAGDQTGVDFGLFH